MIIHNRLKLSNNGSTALHLNILVAQAADIVDIKDERGRTPLQLAVTAGKLDVVKLLVAKGAYIISRDCDGWTALHTAARHGELRTVEVLVTAYDAEVNIVDNRGRTPAHSAACEGYLDTLKFLVESGIDVGIRYKEGRTALHLAALGRPSESRFVDVSREAMSEVYLSVVEYLVEQGADICIEDVNEDTAATLAQREGHLEVVRSLEILLNAKLTDK